MKNFLQVNRALRAKKNFNFNLKSLLVLSAVLLLGSTQVWGDDTYYMQSTTTAGTLTGDFYTTAACTTNVSVSYDGVSYTKAIQPSSGACYSNYTDRIVRYDCKTTSTDFVIVAYSSGSSKQIQVGSIKEAAIGNACTSATIRTKGITKNQSDTIQYSITSTTPASLYVGTNSSSSICIVQIVAVEKGTPLPTPGNIGYSLNLNKGRLVAKSGNTVKLDGSGLEIHPNQDYTAGSGTYCRLGTKGTDYIKFTTGSYPTKLTVNVSSSNTYYVGTTSTATTNESTASQTVNLAKNTPYYINPNGSNVQVTSLKFEAIPYSVDHTLTNVTKLSGSTGSSAAQSGSNYNAVFAAAGGYELPDDITVTIGGNAATAGTDYTWDSSTGAFQVPAAKVDGAIVVTITGEAAASNTYTYTGQDNSWGSTAMTVSDGGLYEYIHSTRQSDHQFKIKEGNNYYNWTYTFPGFCMTNLTTLGNQDGDNCKVWDTPSSYYIIVFKPNTTLNSSSNPRIATSTTLPDDTEEGLAKTKMVYLVPGSGWETSSPKYAVYYEGHSRGWSDYMTASPCIDGAYQVEIPALFSSVQFMRMNPEGGKSWNDGDYWNYTAMVTMPTNKPKFTVNLTNANWNSASTDGSNWATVTTYTISFNANKGSGSISSITGIDCNTSRTLPTNTFTRTGWTFVGWNTDKYGGGTSYADGATISNITSNITLYAQWQRKIYFYSTTSNWYDDDAKTQLHCWDNDDNTKNLYVTMTRSDDCSDPIVYEATIPGGGYDKLQFKRLKSDESVSWNETVDLDFNSSYNMYKLTNMTGGAGDKAYGADGFDANYSIPTFTISYNAGTGGSGTKASESKTCGVDFILPNSAVFTRTGYTQTGWTTSNGGAQTHALGGSYTTNADQTFYPVWSQIMVSSVALNKANTTITEGGTETLTATVLPANALDKSLVWTTSDDAVATVDGGVVTAVGVGSATITATANDGSGQWASCAVTVEEAASCSGDPTALVSGTLYKVEDMASACAAALYGTGQYKYGLSTNGKFYVVGTTDDNNSSTGTVEMKTGDNLTNVGGDADADFTNYAWLKMAGSTSHHSIKFVVPSGGGKLIVYGKGGGTDSGKGNVQIKENSTGTVTEVIAKSSNSACKSSEIAVNAGTYYIYSSGTSAAIYGLRFEQITVPDVSGLGVDDGATMSSIPLSWTIPGICDLSKPVKATMSEVNSNTQETPVYNPSDSTVTAVGSAGYCNQYGIAFSIPEETNVTSVTADWKINSGNLGLFAAIINPSDGKTYWEHNNYYYENDIWNRSTYTINSKYWTDGGGGYSLPTSVQYVGVFANDPGYGGFTNESFSLRDLRYHVSGQNDIDHIVLMRKEGSAATGIADASATKLYEGTKSHYTDASDVTGKNYYYTVFAVHASGAVSTGVSTSLTLYTITYSAGAYGTGTVAAGKKTHGINFTLSSSTFTRDGYTQDGWSTSDGEAKVYELGATYSIDAALTLYPHWVAVSGPVITNGNPANGSIAVTSDGSTPILSAVTGSTVYIAATPSTGYNFTSWDVYKTDESGTKVSLAGSTASTTFEMPAYAVTVNATFTAKTYTVNLNGNGGTGNTANVTATYGSSSFSSSITNPTKTGYIFDGWYSGEGGTGTLIINSSGVLQSSTTYSDGSGNWANDGAVTLYAKWTRDVKTAGWGAPWGGTAIPSNTTSTVSGVTLNACNSAKGTLWSQESYTMGNGDSVTINLASGYYISAVSTAALFDEYGGNTNKLYIQFNSQSTYTNSKYDLDDPITLGDDCYDSWETLGSATPVSVSPIPSGAQSAKIYCEGNSASGNYLYRIIVEITAYDCTPSTVSFNGGDATLGTAPLAREVCGEFTLPGSGSLVYPGYLFSKWNDGEDDYDIGDSYTVTGDVTFTAQWVVDNTSLRIPGSVVTLNRTNDARTTGSDDSTIDIDGDGNADDGINLAGNKYVEWDVYITPGMYNVKSTLCVPSWGIEANVTLIDPAGLEDPIEIYSTGHISGSSGDYKRYSVTRTLDFTGLTANKRYIVRVEDLWEDGSHLRFKDIIFYPFRSITKSATNGTITTQVSGDDVTTAAEGTTIDIAATPNTGYEFTSWTITNTSTSEDVTSTLLGANSTIASTSFTMPAYAVTVTGTFTAVNYTITHSDATNGSYTIKVGDASAVSTNTTANYGQTITLATSPSSGYVIDAWNVTGATVGNNNIASTSFTMPAGNVTVAPTFKLMPNVYYYQDGTRYASSTYKTPKGEAASSGNDQTINSGNEWTVSNSISGLTVSAKGCTYDGKSGSEIHITSYLKVPKGGDNSDKYVKFVVAAGYKATSLKMKIGGYSKNPVVTLKPYVSSSLGDAIEYSGTIGGVATTENNFNEISWTNLAAGTYYLNVGTNNAYISEITAQTEQVGYTVSFAVDGGSTGYGTVSPSSITEVTHGSTVSISENVLTLKATAVTATPTAESDEYTYAFDSWSVSDGASITSAQTITASFTRTAKEYTLTWDLNGGKVSTAGTAAAVDETDPSGSVAYNTALTAPVVTKSGYDFAGWTPSVADNMPAANTTYTALWAERFTVTYNAMTGSVDPTSATGSTANKVSLPEPTKDGYDFDGWYNTAGEKIGDAGDEYGPTAAITLYAKWKGSCAGDDPILSIGDLEGTTSTFLKTYSTEGITISSSSDWETEKGTTEGLVKLGSSGTYNTNYLEVLASSYNISKVSFLLTGNGASKELQPVVFGWATTASGATAATYRMLDSKTVSNKGYSNAEWFTYDLSESSVKCIHLYKNSKNISSTNPEYTGSSEAFGGTNTIWIYGIKVWLDDGSNSGCKTVTYHGNGATSGYVNDPEQYAAGSSVSAKFNSTISGFERTGYEFVEWNTEDDGSGDAYKPFAQITSSIDDDIDLYAQWRIVIDANNTDFAGKDDPTQYRDVKVTKGATLTLTQNTAVRDIIVETGSTLNVSTNSGSPITLSTRSLSLVGGWGTVGNETKYDMPRVYIDQASKITKTTKTINFDIAVDNRNFYPIAVPFPVTVSDVDYVNATLAYYSNYGTSGQYVIKTYDGQKRANADMSNCWRVMRDGTKHYVTSPGEVSEVMVPGQGYILRALPASGYGDYAVIRFPMKNVDDEWTNGGEKGVIYPDTEDKDSKNAVSVVAYENNSGGDTKLSNKGWNILGVPYMTCFVSNELDASPSDAYIKGLLNITTGEYTEDGNVYVTVPKHDFSEYDQLNFSEAKLLPGWCFFVQMDKNATLTFDIDGERASAPFRATMYEHKPTVKTGIILSGAEASDKTTILVSDKYSAADYEINADLEKMFGENSYTLATYSLMGETRLAYNAMSNSDATNVIPIGYRAPADGEYTFAINPRYAENGAFEHVNLIDYETGFVTDLLVSSYSFATERTQNDERFALNVVKAPQTATDITVTGDGLQVTGPQKVIINDKLYIIVEGKMYSAEGALVK